MPDLLADFETYFLAQGITSGAYFKDTTLDTPSDCVSIFEYAGGGSYGQIAGTSRSIQIVARDEKATLAKAKASELYKALQTEDGILNLTAERWCTIFLRQTPFKMKVDSQGRTYYCFNVGVTTYID
jgi:Bacteriophage minor capsid protein